MSHSILKLSSVVLFVALFQSGCGEKRVNGVGGTVKHSGQPIANLIVNFLPEKGMRASGMTDAQGKFTLVSAEGLPVGACKVWVTLPMTSPKDEALHQAVEKNREDPTIQEILRKYGNSEATQLIVEVKKSGHSIEINLD